MINKCPAACARNVTYFGRGEGKMIIPSHKKSGVIVYFEGSLNITASILADYSEMEKLPVPFFNVCFIFVLSTCPFS